MLWKNWRGDRDTTRSWFIAVIGNGISTEQWDLLSKNIVEKFSPYYETRRLLLWA